MTTDLYTHYRAVLDDLAAQRRRLSQEIAEVDAAIAAIQRRVGTAGRPSVAEDRILGESAQASTECPMKYSGISVRWAVLGFLAEEATGPMGTGAIAEALEQRGVKKAGPSRFGNIVSAVISHLKSKGELEAVDGGLYQLTKAGREMWGMIRASAKFRQTQDATTAPGLLDAQ